MALAQTQGKPPRATTESAVFHLATRTTKRRNRAHVAMANQMALVQQEKLPRATMEPAAYYLTFKRGHTPLPDDDSPSSTSGEQAITQEGHEAHEDTSRYNSGPGGIPEPRGEPSKLTSQQRVRLHELLRSGDLEGLDRSASDEDLWRAYRKKKSDHRALRKRKRADGTWRKDDGRGWPPHPNRERSLTKKAGNFFGATGDT